MDQRTKVIIGTLVVVSALLAAGLVVALTRDTDNGTAARMPMGMKDSYVGMMQAMGGMDSDAMLTHMQEVLGEDGYRRMLDHWASHRAGGPMTGNPGADAMMHQMMDSMMQRMPADRGRLLPLPATSPTATPRP